MEVNIPEELITRISNGDRTAIPEIIELHLPLTYVIAARHKRRYDKFPDLQSEATLGLAKAVNWIFESRCEHGNYTGYIVKTIRGHLERLQWNDHVIPMSRDDYRQRKQINVFDLDKLLGLEESSQYNAMSETSSPKYKSHHNMHGLRHCMRGHQEDNLMMESMIYELGLNSVERKVVAGLMASMTVREIGDDLGMSKSRVGQHVESIREKVTKYNGKA